MDGKQPVRNAPHRPWPFHTSLNGDNGADKPARAFPRWWWELAALAAGAGAGVAGYAFFHEPLTVRLDRVDIHVECRPGALPRAGLRILHLSDTHFRGADWREHPKINRIHALCRDLSYDLLVHTGDFLHYDSGLANVVTLLEGLPEPRLGRFAVLGNHDYMTYSYDEIITRSWQAYHEEMHRARAGGVRRLHFGVWAWVSLLVRFGYYFLNAPLSLKRSGPNNIARLEAALCNLGFQTLYNRAVHLQQQPGAEGEAAGLDLWLAGVDDLTEGAPNLRSALAAAPEDALTVLLAHNPGVLFERASRRAQVILSGHTHGGQIVLPFIGAAHTQTHHLRRHQAAGLLRRDGTQIYISRGIGEGIPIRFAAPPQLSLITLYPKL